MIRSRPLARLLGAALLLTLTGACRKAPESRVGASAPRYTVRGEVVQVMEAPAGRTLLVRHEAIPEFEDASGARVGMKAMVMPFEVGPSLGAEGLKPGDRIRLRFAVEWKSQAMVVEAVEPLPAADRALVFDR
jgi:Cu/Ag efflux protein CusF